MPYRCSLLAALSVVAALAACAKHAPDSMPATPPEVRGALDDTAAAFREAQTAPTRIQQLVLPALTRLRQALAAWSDAAEGMDVRSQIRGWSLEAGMLETSLGSLPPRPSDQDVKPVYAAWSALRAKLP